MPPRFNFPLQAIFTTYGFHFPITVAMLQMAFISPVTYILARPTLSWNLLKGLAPLATVNVLNVVSGLVGTGGLNVPMFIALRRFTLLFTILLERYWLKKSHDWPTLSAMAIMIGGALVAAATDLTFNPSGYAAVLCNDLLTSLYLIMVKNTPATNGLSTTGMLFYNSSLSIPMLFAAMVYMGEPAAIGTYPRIYDPQFLVSSNTGFSLHLRAPKKLKKREFFGQPKKCDFYFIFLYFILFADGFIPCQWVRPQY